MITDPNFPEATACDSLACPSAAVADTSIARDVPAILPAPFPALTTSIQPVADIRAYLATRKPRPHYAEEQAIFVTLPLTVKAELRALLGCRPGGGVFGLVAARTTGRGAVSVSRAVKRVVPLFPDHHWKEGTLRARYDAWRQAGDWVSLVNRSKAGAEWQDRNDTLPEPFLRHAAQVVGAYKRADAKRQAILSLRRQYLTGRDGSGQIAPIPGYESRWRGDARNTTLHACPSGWSYSNILRQIAARNLLPKSVVGLLHEGSKSARQHLPLVIGTRDGIRFLEKVQFDDVKTDWVILDTASGQVNDLWLLVAHDVATTMCLGYGLRPARLREDGTQEHLKLDDMRLLLGWLLQTYGLPAGYPCHWWFERGTATIAQAAAAAIAELLGPGRIECHWTGMIGGKSPLGYTEKRIGNSGAKGSLESCNRLLHTIGASVPGQTGNLYQRRPQDLPAQIREAETAWKLSQALPPELRGQVGYSVLDLVQARDQLRRIVGVRNTRTDHEIEGFSTVLEWIAADGSIAPQSTIPVPLPAGAKIIRRKESPMERAARLIRDAGCPFDPVSPDVVAAFLSTTQRDATIRPSGDIELRMGDRPVVYRLPDLSALMSIPSLPFSALAYYFPDRPDFLHVTDRRGSYLGCWLRAQAVRMGDQEALNQAIRYSAGALKAARAAAADLAAPERQRLEDTRARNAEIFASFDSAAVAAESPRRSASSRVGGPVASALASIPIQRQAAQATAATDAALAASLDAVS